MACSGTAAWTVLWVSRRGDTPSTTGLRDEVSRRSTIAPMAQRRRTPYEAHRKRIRSTPMQHDHAIRSWTVLSLLLGAVCLLGLSPSAQADELRRVRETLQVKQLQVFGASPPVPALGAARL